MKIKFLYIEYGNQDNYFQELKYSLATLLDQHNLTSDKVLVYTENIKKYERLPVTAVSINKDIYQFSLNGKYHFRIKPCVIKRVLEEQDANVKIVFMDTDTYVKKPLLEKVMRIDSRTVLMNAKESLNPYPGSRLDNLILPSGKLYSYDPTKSLMYNSGLLGVDRNHIPHLTDAIHIIDAMFNAGFTAHTIEQCAITEAFRISGVEIVEVKKEIEHYWRRTDRKYMHAKIRSLNEDANSMPEERISHSWFLARLYRLSANR